MNNEPVAWAYIKDGEFWDAIHPDEHAKEEGSYNIPLYTHPAKTLDKELLDKTIIDQQNEIKELRKNLDVALMIVNEPAKTLTDEEIIKTMVQFDVYSADDQCLIEAARAILKKASEK